MRICYLEDFAIPADHSVKIKESNTKDKYLDLAREQKKLWNMRVMVMPVVVSELRMLPKSLEKELEKLKISVRIETFQTSVLIKSARILRRVLKTWGDLLSLRLQWKTTNSNTQKSPGDLKRLVVTQTPVKDHQLEYSEESWRPEETCCHSDSSEIPPANYYHYYYLLIWVFHISLSWWSFTGVWRTASLLKSLGLFSVFWPFSIM